MNTVTVDCSCKPHPEGKKCGLGFLGFSWSRKKHLSEILQVKARAKAQGCWRILALSQRPWDGYAHAGDSRWLD